MPARVVITHQAQIGKAAQQHFRVENPHHQLFAKSGRQGGHPQFDFTAITTAGFDTAILRFALFGDIHPRQHFEAASHGGGYIGGQFVDVVQNTVDAEADAPYFPAWLYVDIRSALVVGVLQQPIHNLDDMLVIGIWIAGFAKLNQLLEVGNRRGRCGATGARNRTSEGIKLHHKTLDICGVGHHPLNRAPRHMLHLGFPARHKRLGTGDDHMI